MNDEPEDIAGRLIADLGSAGEHVADGRFTLDAAAAYRKLREHQLADPLAYLLVLIEAAWLAGDTPAAARVHVETGTTTGVEWHGLAPALGSLPDLFTAVLGGLDGLDGEALRRRRILQLLGLAVNSALALAPERIVIAAREGDGPCEAIAVAPDGAVTILDAEQLPPSTTSVRVEGGLRDLARGKAIRELLRRRCTRTIMTVSVDRQPISRGEVPLPVPTDGEPIHHPEIVVGLVERTRDDNAPGVAWFVNRGVALRDAALELPRGCEAFVEVDLAVDLSRQQLLETPALDAIREQVRAAATALAARPRRRKSPGDRIAIAVQVAMIAVLIIAFGWELVDRMVLAPKRERDNRARRLVWACETGDAQACASVASQTKDPLHRQRANQYHCVAGSSHACVALTDLVADALGDASLDSRAADESLAALCEATQASAYCTTIAGLRHYPSFQSAFWTRACADGSLRACKELDAARGR